VALTPVSGRTLVYAASVQPPPIGDMPPIGGALGQTMRLSIRAVEDPDQRCAADLTVRDANGAALATVRKTLGPGEGGFLDLRHLRHPGRDREGYRRAIAGDPSG
jgi:hypothetical protein